MTNEERPSPFRDFDDRLAKLKPKDARSEAQFAAEAQKRGRALSKGWQAGIEMVGGTAGGALIGLGIDYVAGTAPWAMIIGFVLGSVGGIWNAYKVMQGLTRDAEEGNTRH
ncbi:MAG: AtpZ/AtpI family protein [Geminicoccaceae bacterium]